MANYVPRHQPQDVGLKAGKDGGESAYSEEHLRQFVTFGPPPRNYFAARVVYHDRSTGRQVYKPRMLYADHSVDSTAISIRTGASYLHPFAPGAPTGTVLPEFPVERDPSPGFFHPPVEYQPDVFSWKQHDCWQDALTAALAYEGVTNKTTGRAWDKAAINSLHQQLLTREAKTESNRLWHPSDRGTAVYRNEPALALVARWIEPGFNVVVVNPLQPADGKNWDHMWNKVMRPPFYTRWSVGGQGVFRVLLVGCLPKPHSTTGREWISKEVYWCSLVPKQGTEFEKTWNRIWFRNDPDGFKKLPNLFSFPSNVFTNQSDTFVWSVVRLHRKIAFGLENKLKDGDLGNWIYQFGQHLKNCRAVRKYSPFKFKPEQRYGGRETTYQELTAWVLNAKFLGAVGARYISYWNEYHQALINYNMNLNQANWNTVVKKMELISGAPL